MGKLPIAHDRELELKFELAPGELHRLGEALRAKGPRDEQSRKMLRSIYFDTPGHDLRMARIALRLRNDGGKKWLQTVKTGEAGSGLADVGQVEAVLDRGAPNLDRVADKRLRRKIKEICRKTRLAPVFETHVERMTKLIEKPDCSAELALDEGRVEAGGRSRPISEAELELRSGSTLGLLAIATEIFSDVRIRPSESSKAALGFGLLNPAPEIAEAPRAALVALRESDMAKDAFAAILRSASRHIIANESAVLKSGDVEAVHQMRVGLTRLRAALRSMRPYTDAPWVGELERDAQTVARIVSALRDADVLIAEIYTPIAEEKRSVPGFPGLLAALRAHRDAVYKQVVEDLGAAVRSRLLITLILSPLLIESGGGFKEPVSKIAGASLERCWKRVRGYGQRLDALDLEERHSMRKALKKLRYNAEFFQTLYGRSAKSFIERLKTLQELFGVINDARMAERLIDIALERSGDSQAAAAAGYIMGRHEANTPQVWSKVQHEWERLEKAAGFWR